MHIINDESSLGDIIRAKRDLENFFDESLHKHHPGQEHLAYGDDDY